MDSVNTDTEVPEKKSSLLKNILRLIIPLGIGVAILWFLYRETDFDKMWETIQDANFAILLFSLIFGLVGNIIRALRWELLIRPLGYNPSRRNLIYAVLGNYAVNLALPRAGEIWRCGVIAKSEKIPFVKLLGTLIIDRAFDTIMVLLITLFACTFNVDVFVNYIQENEALSGLADKLIYSQWTYITLALGLIFLVLVFTVFKNTSIVLKIKGFFKGIWNDMKQVTKMREKGKFLIYTVSIWVCYFLYFYVTLYAFEFTAHLGFTAGLVAFALSSISMAIPTNGGIGVWHAAVVLSLGLYGVTKSSAEAFAFAVFTIQNLWIIIYGTFSIAAISFKKDSK